MMPSEKRSRKVELQNNEIEDMLGRVPGWITRNGVILFLFLLVLLIFGSWVLRYPEIKKASIIITSVNPPADLEARTSGKIAELFVTDNEKVNAGDVLAMIENPASFDDVQKLEKDLSVLDSTQIQDYSEDLPVRDNAQLGTIQSEYSLFLKSYRDFIEFKRLDSHQRRIQLLRTELGRQQEYGRSLTARVAIAKEEYDLAQSQAARNAELLIESVISEAEMEVFQSEMLSKRNKYQEIVSLVAENEITIGKIEEQIVEQELGQRETLSQSVNLVEESLNNLKASIDAWEQTYLLVAPVSGTVVFTRFWSANQNVGVGEKVMTIIPNESGSMVGKISLPAAGAGKVKVTHQVNILFDNYPHLEYGMVRGEVSNISQISDENVYTVEVTFPDGLTTFYDIDIPFSQNMQGKAQILTDKKRVLHRILEPVRSIVSKQVEM